MGELGNGGDGGGSCGSGGDGGGSCGGDGGAHEIFTCSLTHEPFTHE